MAQTSKATSTERGSVCDRCCCGFSDFLGHVTSEMTLVLEGFPGCGLRARMLSVLSTSWQQQHGPGRRRRCGNGAARVAEPAFSPARSPREALPSSPRRPGRPRGGSGGGEPGAPRERPPGAGRPGSSRRPGPRGAEEGRPGWDASQPGPRSAAGRGGKRLARRARGRAAAGERTLLATARAQVISNTTCLTTFLATLSKTYVFHCLQKIKIALEIGDIFDLKEQT